MIAIQAGMRDAPHLSVADKLLFLRAIPPYQLMARIAGIAGHPAVSWPVIEDQVEYDPRTLLEAAALERTRRSGRKIDLLFPDGGPLRRALYVKHLEFFKAGALHRERLFLAGNRVGKSDTGCYEDTLHLTGDYPHWWEGRRFACPVEAWVAGDTSLTVRDILQQKLLGKWGEFGTGLIPRDALVHWTAKRGVPDTVDTIFVKSLAGGVSSLSFKSYAEGRENYQGSARHLIHCDEEPPSAIWTECLMRSMIVPHCAEGGICMITMTPVEGWSELIETFLGAQASAPESATLET